MEVTVYVLHKKFFPAFMSLYHFRDKCGLSWGLQSSTGLSGFWRFDRAVVPLLSSPTPFLNRLGLWTWDQQSFSICFFWTSQTAYICWRMSPLIQPPSSPPTHPMISDISWRQRRGRRHSYQVTTLQPSFSQHWLTCSMKNLLYLTKQLPYFRSEAKKNKFEELNLFPLVVAVTINEQLPQQNV